MGARAYNRGTRALRHRLDREAATRRRLVYCGGRVRNGPHKRWARCPLCGAVDYELNEGDRCRALVRAE